ncbi:MAG: ribosomal protein L10e/L16 [Monoraphidium minutum]|nr:MAG: ribosomal protein L10e/L16 [Monoraphidium minutum]
MLSRLAQLSCRLGAAGASSSGGGLLWGQAAAAAAAGGAEAAAAAAAARAARAPAAAAPFHSSSAATALMQRHVVAGGGGGLVAFGFLQQQQPPAWRAPPGGAAPGRQAQAVRRFQLMPRRTKYRKAFKSLGFNEVICPNTRQLAWGKYGIRAVDHARVPARTVEAVRRVIRRTVGKGAMMWIRVTPNVPVSSKPAEVRMGKGKGAVDYWAAPVRPGQIIFEFDRVPRKVALDAVAAAAPKLPMRVGFVEWS